MALDLRMTRLVKASPEAIAAAATCLRAGGLVAMPTETVYGLAADATSDAAVAAIYAAKERPAINPLIAHVLGIEAAREHGLFGADAETLARAFWPGPLTLVLPVAPASRISLLARAGLDTVAIRAPSHETARALIEAAGVPLAAPSANRSGRVSPTTAAHVAADLDGRVDFILDAGPCRHGLESTIVACLGPRPQLLRPGAITREAIESALRAPIEWAERGAKRPERAGATGVALCAEGRASARRGQRRGGRSRARFRRRARRRRRARPARSFAVRRPRRGGGASLFLSSHARRRGASDALRSRRSLPMGLGRRSTIGCAGRPRPGTLNDCVILWI